MGGKKITKSAFDKLINNFKDDLLPEDKARASGYNENTNQGNLDGCSTPQGDYIPP